MTAYDTSDVGALYATIGQALLAAAPPDWVHLRATYVELGNTAEIQAAGVTTDGIEVRFRRVPKDLWDALEALRKVMYQEGKGAWYTARVTVTRDLRTSLDFDYDHEPALDRTFLPGSFLEDLEKYPREEATWPGWLREKVAQAREEAARPQLAGEITVNSDGVFHPQRLPQVTSPAATQAAQAVQERLAERGLAMALSYDTGLNGADNTEFSYPELSLDDDVLSLTASFFQTFVFITSEMYGYADATADAVAAQEQLVDVVEDVTGWHRVTT